MKIGEAMESIGNEYVGFPGFLAKKLETNFEDEISMSLNNSQLSFSHEAHKRNSKEL